MFCTKRYLNNVDVHRQCKDCCKTERNLRSVIRKHFALNINKAQGDSKLVWRTPNELTSTKSSHQPSLVTKFTTEGGKVTYPEIISDLFYDFFKLILGILVPRN